MEIVCVRINAGIKLFEIGIHDLERVGMQIRKEFLIFFVFNEKGKSKTVKGFVIFAVFSAIGLLIHEVGMYLFSDVWGMNEWVAKIILTIVVLVYNYVSRKLLIFKKDKAERGGEIDEEDQSDNTLL